MKNRFVRGDHNVISDDSGQKFKRSECVYTWDNKLVHRATEYQPKHPQLEIRGRTERIGVANGTRTQGDDLALELPSFDASDGI